jgi:predicted nucleic acid-binding protein
LIVVDSSVWIGNLRGNGSKSVAWLQSVQVQDAQNILVGDLILMEVLQGVRDEPSAGRIERDLRQFTVASMLTPDLAVKATSHYRLLRSLGITVRRTVDMIIGAFCIDGGHSLLHDDRDFDPMVRHLGLNVIKV